MTLKTIKVDTEKLGKYKQEFEYPADNKFDIEFPFAEMDDEIHIPNDIFLKLMRIIEEYYD